jgi:hypothetical protein
MVEGDDHGISADKKFSFWQIAGSLFLSMIFMREIKVSKFCFQWISGD